MDLSNMQPQGVGFPQPQPPPYNKTPDYPMASYPPATGQGYAPGPPPPGQGYPPAMAPSTVTNNTTNNNNNNNNNNMINNTVVIGQPGGGGNSLLLVPKEKWNSRDWNSGLCSCLNDCTSCVFGCVCVLGLLARVANRMDECCLLPCLPGAPCAMRTKVRTMGGIRGSIWCDNVATWCCPWCAACQMSRELDAMGI